MSARRRIQCILSVVTLVVVARGAWCDTPPPPPSAHDRQNAQPTEMFTLLDGTQFSARLTRLHADGTMEMNQSDRETTIDRVWRLQRRDVEHVQTEGTVEVRVAGCVVTAHTVSVKDGRCKVEWVYSPELLDFPLESVQALRLWPRYVRAPNAEAAWARALEGLGTDDRMIAVGVAGKAQTVHGALLEISEDVVLFQYEGEVRRIGRERVYGVVLGGPIPAEPMGLACRVTMRDSSVLVGSAPRMDEGFLSLSPVGSPRIRASWAHVRAMDVRSDRMRFLSDMTPVFVEEEPILTLPLPWQRDRNLLHGPMGVGDRVCTRGLAVHARTTLTFRLDAQWIHFAAILGLDAKLGRKGNCVFVVLGDGRELLRRRVRGTDEPLDVVLEIEGVRELLLLVEAGEDYDLGDHANWCEARVIR